MPTAKQCRFNLLIPTTKSRQSTRFWVYVRIFVAYIYLIKYMPLFYK